MIRIAHLFVDACHNACGHYLLKDLVFLLEDLADMCEIRSFQENAKGDQQGEDIRFSVEKVPGCVSGKA